MDLKEGTPWEELDDTEDKVRQLYKIIQSNCDLVEPNGQGELDLGSLTSIDRNSDVDLYDWQLEKYESYEKDCWTIQVITKNQVCTDKVRNFYSISIVPKVMEKKIR